MVFRRSKQMQLARFCIELAVIEALQEKLKAHTRERRPREKSDVWTRRASRRYCALLDGPAQIYQYSPYAPHRSRRESRGRRRRRRWQRLRHPLPRTTPNPKPLTSDNPFTIYCPKESELMGSRFVLPIACFR